MIGFFRVTFQGGFLAALFCALFPPRSSRARAHIRTHTNDIIDNYLLYYYIYIIHKEGCNNIQDKTRKQRTRKRRKETSKAKESERKGRKRKQAKGKADNERRKNRDEKQEEE